MVGLGARLNTFVVMIFTACPNSHSTSMPDNLAWEVVGNASQVKETKTRLEREGKFDKGRKIKFENGAYHLPLLGDGPYCEDSATVDKLAQKLSTTRYSIYPPMVLFNSMVTWTDEEARILVENSSKYFGLHGITHLALNARLVPGDEVRSPSFFTPIYGNFGPAPGDGSPGAKDFDEAFWCSCIQHKITQIWAPRYTMFSRGNIREKIRVRSFEQIMGNDIVDLYCGIGYFSLAYAFNLPRRIFAWDINPWSIEGFMRGAKANKVNARLVTSHPVIDYSTSEPTIFAFLEDNQASYETLANAGDVCITHINMGLLPDCKKVWKLAALIALLPNNQAESTTLHIHENVAEPDIQKWTQETLQSLHSHVKDHATVQFKHVEKIKTFAPSVFHVCGDFSIKKMTST